MHTVLLVCKNYTKRKHLLTTGPQRGIISSFLPNTVSSITRLLSTFITLPVENDARPAQARALTRARAQVQNEELWTWGLKKGVYIFWKLTVTLACSGTFLFNPFAKRLSLRACKFAKSRK